MWLCRCTLYTVQPLCERTVYDCTMCVWDTIQCLCDWTQKSNSYLTFWPTINPFQPIWYLEICQNIFHCYILVKWGRSEPLLSPNEPRGNWRNLPLDGERVPYFLTEIWWGLLWCQIRDIGGDDSVPLYLTKRMHCPFSDKIQASKLHSSLFGLDINFPWASDRIVCWISTVVLFFWAVLLHKEFSWILKVFNLKHLKQLCTVCVNVQCLC